SFARGLADDAPLDFKEPSYSDEISLADLPVEEAASLAPPPLEIPAILQMIREAAKADSGEAPYTSVETRQPEHGLAFGLVLFTQASGRLGSMLGMMQARDPQAFVTTFGPNAEELLKVTTAATVEQRLAAVGGEALTSDSWVARFRAA